MIVLGNDVFAENLAKALSSDFVKIEQRGFPDGEVCPRILVTNTLKGEHVILSHRMSVPINPNKYLMETFLLLRTLNAFNPSQIDVLMPYFVYSRQDKVFRLGEPASAKYILEILKSLGCSRFFTVSNHFQREKEIMEIIEGFPTFNVDGYEPLAHYLKTLKLINPIVIGSDLTADSATKKMSKILGADTSVIEKERDLETGEIKTYWKSGIERRDVILLDDQINTGGTMLRAINSMNESGAQRVICATVHPILANNAYEKISPLVWKFIATDTIDSPVSLVSVVGKVTEAVKK